MITADFYPFVTPPGQSYLTEFTDLIGNLTYDDANNIADAYLMGYIPYDEMPDVLGISLSKSENGDITFTDVCSIENVPWFFVGKYSTNASNRYESGTYIYNPDTEKLELRDTAQSRGEYGFLNNAAIPSLISGGYIQLHFTCQMQQSDGTYINWWNSKSSNPWLDFSLHPADFFSFMKGDLPIAFSINKEGVNASFNIYYDDLKTGHYQYIDSDTGKKVNLFITDFLLPMDMRDVNSSDSTVYFSCAFGAILRHVNHPVHGIVPYITNEYPFHYGYSYESSTENNFIGWDGTNFSQRYQLYPNSGLCMGGYKCSIPASYWNTPNGTTEIFGNCVVTHRTGSNPSRIYRLFTPDEINRTLLLRFTRLEGRSTVGIHYGYRTGIYYPIFNEDNSPKWEWKDGSFDDLVSVLRPWQMANIILDEFTPDDIPGYNPEPSEWGDDRYGNVPGLWYGSDGITANFITPWVLRGSQVSGFGKFLWENLFLPDPDDPSVIDGLWKNFMDALGSYFQTGSFDPSSTLDFVVSLYYFPFSLSSYATDSTTKKLYFGTGALGLTISNTYNTYILNTYHTIIGGGSLDLNNPTVKQNLNIPDDFRGLANTSACIYLPFCGTYEINWADIKDSALSIQYAIDFSTGACIAYVTSTKSGVSTYVLCATGCLGFQVPLSATNANRISAAIIGDIAKTGTNIVDKGQNIASTIMHGGSTENSNVSGNTSDTDANTLTMGATGGAVGLTTGSIMQTGNALKQAFSKPSIGIPLMRGGSGWNALHCPRSAYLQVRTPQYIPDLYHGHALGWCAEKKSTVSSLPTPESSNFYQCISVDTSGMSCSKEECDMIKNLLQSGFYIKSE